MHKRLFLLLGCLGFTAVMAAVFLFYTLWGYLIWQWLRPDSFLDFVVFVVAWSAASWVATFALKQVLRLLRPHIPWLDRQLTKREKPVPGKAPKTAPPAEEENWFHPYAKPDLLHQFGEFQQEFERLNILWADDIYYAVTPIDSVSFCHTGGDGCHFAFLTDFGQHTDLENAPIVFVSPMDWDDYVRIVAWNIRDLLGLVLHFGYSEIFRCNLDDFEKLDEARQQAWTEQSLQTPEMKRFFDLLHTRFQVPQFDRDTAFSYLKNLAAHRKQHALLPTLDGLGIPNIPFGDTLREYNFEDISPQSVSAFLESADRPERLKFYRDFKFKAGFDMPMEIKSLLMRHLWHDGFKREASLLEKLK